MKHLKIYESYFSNSFSIHFSEDTMMYAYWDVYYPIASKNDKYPVMSYKDYITSILDSLSGEIIDRLPGFLPRYDKNLKNLNIDFDNLEIKIPSNTEIDDKIIDEVHNFIQEEGGDFMNNRFKKMDKIEYQIYLDNTLIKDFTGDFDYSKIDKTFLQDLIDRALDDKDFKRAEKLGKYLKL